MGARASDTLKEIEELRRGLDRKLVELEQRLPPVARLGKTAAGLALGGGLGTSVLWAANRRRRARRRAPEVAARGEIVVTVLPKGAVAVAAAAVAVWAGVRIFEARIRREATDDAAFEPAVVTPIGESGRPATSG